MTSSSFVIHRAAQIPQPVPRTHVRTSTTSRNSHRPGTPATPPAPIASHSETASPRYNTPVTTHPSAQRPPEANSDAIPRPTNGPVGLWAAAPQPVFPPVTIRGLKRRGPEPSQGIRRQQPWARRRILHISTSIRSTSVRSTSIRSPRPMSGHQPPSGGAPLAGLRRRSAPLPLSPRRNRHRQVPVIRGLGPKRGPTDSRSDLGPHAETGETAAVPTRRLPASHQDHLFPQVDPRKRRPPGLCPRECGSG